MAETLDYINLMSYDYHGWFPNHSYTGHNSPLYAMPEEMDPYHPGYQMNTDFSVQYWLDGGAKKEQLLLGKNKEGELEVLKRTFRDTVDNGKVYGGIVPARQIRRATDI